MYVQRKFNIFNLLMQEVGIILSMFGHSIGKWGYNWINTGISFE